MSAMPSWFWTISLLLAPIALPAPPSTPSRPAERGTQRVAGGSAHWAVAFSPDGRTLAVGAYKTLLLFDPVTGVRRAAWNVSEDAVRAVAFSPDGKSVAVGTGVPGRRGTVRLLDAATGKTLRDLPGHDDTVEALAFSGATLLSAASDERVRLVDLVSGKPVGALTEHLGRCLSVAVPTQSTPADGGAIFATGGADRMLKIWDAERRRVVVNFDQCQSPVWALAATPQPGRFLAGGGDGTLRLFGVYTERDKDGNLRGGVDGEPTPRGGYQALAMGAHEGPIYAVAADARYLYAGGADGKVTVWNYGAGKVREFADARADIWGLAVSPDGKLLAAASRDGHTRLYDVDQGQLVWELPVTPRPVDPAVAQARKRLPPLPSSGQGLRVQFYPDPRLVSSPIFSRIDNRLSFAWSAEPFPDGPADNFGAVWEGFVEAPVDGRFRFVTRSDEGVRLWIDGVKVIDNWTDHGPTDDAATRTIPLARGQRAPIRLEYYDKSGAGEIHLFWEYDGQERQLVPMNRLYPWPDDIPAPRKD